MDLDVKKAEKHCYIGRQDVILLLFGTQRTPFDTALREEGQFLQTEQVNEWREVAAE